jgi:WD40 repeat protein
LIEAISPSVAHRVARGGDDGTLRVVRLQVPSLLEEEVFAWTGHSGPISALAWSPRGQHIATGGVDGQVLLWDGESGVLLDTCPLQAPRGAITALAWLDDSKLAVSAGDALTILTTCLKQAV